MQLLHKYVPTLLQRRTEGKYLSTQTLSESHISSSFQRKSNIPTRIFQFCATI